MFQSVITPNGLICHLFGPLEGRRHDAFMLHESGLLQELARKMEIPMLSMGILLTLSGGIF